MRTSSHVGIQNGGGPSSWGRGLLGSPRSLPRGHRGSHGLHGRASGGRGQPDIGSHGRRCKRSRNGVEEV
jgi:hypothetical protein